jgi:hypothetical protein
MILSVAAIMHDHEPYAIRRYSKFLSARIFREGISFAIAGGRSSAAPEHEVNQNCAAGEQDGESYIQQGLRAGPCPRTFAVIDGLHLMP